MSVKQYLRDSGLFDENPPQKNPTYPGTVCFPLRRAERGASIYATDAGTFGIRIQALDKGRFGKANAELFTFAHANYCEISPNNQKAYMIFDSHIAEVVDIIRGGRE